MWGERTESREIMDQGKEEIVVAVTVTDTIYDLDLDVQSIELTGADWKDSMSIHTEMSFLLSESYQS